MNKNAGWISQQIYNRKCPKFNNFRRRCRPMAGSTFWLNWLQPRAPNFNGCQVLRAPKPLQKFFVSQFSLHLIRIDWKDVMINLNDPATWPEHLNTNTHAETDCQWSKEIEGKEFPGDVSKILSW